MDTEKVYEHLDMACAMTEDREHFLGVVYKYILDTQDRDNDRKLVDLYAVYEGTPPSNSGSTSDVTEIGCECHCDSDFDPDEEVPDAQPSYQTDYENKRIECHSWFQSPTDLQLRYALPEIANDQQKVLLRMRGNVLTINIEGENGFNYKALLTNPCRCGSVRYTIIDKKLHLFLEKTQYGMWDDLFMRETYEPVTQQ